MHLIKIPLHCKWFFSALRYGGNNVKNLHHKAEKKSVRLSFRKPLSDAQVIVCVKTFVKTCYRRMIRLYCWPKSHGLPFQAQILLLAESGDADVKA
ncbi:hypothetical protein EAN74_14395 [Salmonella enterica]|nr:hypothetical protein [Salmonella enterica]